MTTIKTKLQKWYFAWPTMIGLFILFFLLNLYLMGGGDYKISDIHLVISHLFTKANDDVFAGVNEQTVQEIQEKVWALLATIVGGVALGIAGLITQALTRNPLADASTLGMSQAGIFGIVLALSFGFTAYYIKFMFAVIFGVVGAVLLLLIIWASKSSSTQTSKIILAGLAIGIIFKTITFLIRHNDKFLNDVSYKYVLGGAEGINTVIGDNQYLILLISTILTIVAVAITITISKGLTLLELGDERAKSLGTKVKTVKALSLIALGIAVPAAIIILGNIAFIGLFAVHLSRYLLTTRNYKKLIAPTIIVSVTITAFGLFLTQYIPKVNSGLWMTFIGAPYLIYAGLRGLR